MAGVLATLLILIACASPEPELGGSTVQEAVGDSSPAVTARRDTQPADPREEAGGERSVASIPDAVIANSAGAAQLQQEQDTIRARYPKEWEVEVPQGTALDSLRRELDRQMSLLPALDTEDQTPLPIWFRVYLRKQNPDLPTSGPYQYPRTAPRLLQWMLAHPDSVPEQDEVRRSETN